MKTEQLIKNVEASNLSKEDKQYLKKLLRERRFDEYLKILVKLIGLGSVFWD